MQANRADGSTNGDDGDDAICLRPPMHWLQLRQPQQADSMQCLWFQLVLVQSESGSCRLAQDCNQLAQLVASVALTLSLSGKRQTDDGGLRKQLECADGGDDGDGIWAAICSVCNGLGSYKSSMG